MRVLIVDDERMGRDSLKALLSICDFAVETAATAAEALGIAERQQLQIVVIDWMLGHQESGLTWRMPFESCSPVHGS